MTVVAVFGGTHGQVGTEAWIQSLLEERKSCVLPNGELMKHGRGVCRHLALLYKYICDRCDLPCALERGLFFEDGVVDFSNEDDLVHHAWNRNRFSGEAFLVDLQQSTELTTFEEADQILACTGPVANWPRRNHEFASAVGQRRLLKGVQRLR